ncbi:methylmalonyl Co-A mutase-associated GTPase MeaB [Ferruginivarius sediminum]|uniref:Methylmalonyl Co-A mutase-associated GTPase MeaB n=1 Tax=Ferruginivarius sediminum TaxID=2661937 RepID=A0A369TB27_9PROT|nr:methylmalonyl Co-A mutase-associated GTPase MeaB [Ferruginivarius sediminum]RDD61704.1 methylmalonyl Co-A mutase-associated GTPase MeaB [Ferruginivarius sediminum]
MSHLDPVSLAKKVRARDRRALARAITLVESTRRDHRDAAEALLAELLADTGGAVRLGISGVPGVGKSTFIEAFGLHVIGEGHRVAVLAVDPTSSRTGGSILGDKTRMQELSRNADAFIRPSPTGGTLGGVARRTREAMLVCEAAGFDVVVVETVGVGQSEIAVADMVDMFLLLLLPGGGDELQGIKKGISEIADLLVVNKADAGMKDAARAAAAEYKSALRMLRPANEAWKPPVLTCSALEHRGIDKVWAAISDYRQKLGDSGDLARRRAEQARSWMWNEVEETLLRAFKDHPGVARRLPDLERAVTEGRIPAAAAARELLDAFLERARVEADGV